MSNDLYDKILDKLENMEERISDKILDTVKNQAEKQAIICNSQCVTIKSINDKLNSIDEKLVGNGKPGINERLSMLERNIKLYNYVLGILLTSAIGWIAIDLVKKYLLSGLLK